MARSILKIILSKLIGVMLFLIFVFFINYLGKYIESTGYHIVIRFMNNNILLLVMLSLIFMTAEIFSAIIFPFNLPAPLFNAIGAMLVIRFILNVFSLIDTLLSERIFAIFSPLRFIIYPVVFFIVLIVGYVNIFSGLLKRKKHRKSHDKSWNEVSGQFKKAFSDLSEFINDKFE